LREADDLLLKALSDEANGWIVKRNVLESPMVTAMASGVGDMADAFREIAPNAESDDGKSLTYLACLVNWIQAGCPIEGDLRAKAAVAAAPLRPPRPFRYPWGMGKVH
jgi:hypothetical protein